MQTSYWFDGMKSAYVASSLHGTVVITQWLDGDDTTTDSNFSEVNGNRRK